MSDSLNGKKSRGMKMEESGCGLCGSGKAARLFTVRAEVAGETSKLDYVRCAGCGLVRLNPRPEAESLAALYEGLDVCAGAERGESIYETDQVSRREFVERWRRGGSLLDVGTGDGRFLLEMRRAGWDVAGVEIAPGQALYQCDKLGLDVRTGTIESADFGGRVFDVITMWASLEHMPAPRAALERAAGLLTENGIIIVGVPNVGSIEASVFRGGWYGLCAPFHLYMFEPRTMKALAGRAGLKVSETVFSSTATTLLESLKGMRRPAGAGTKTESEAVLSDRRNVGGSAGFLKKAVFGAMIVPALKLLDLLGLGVGTIYVLENKK